MIAQRVVIAVITFLSLPLDGHVGDRIIPIFEITDDMLEQIDLRDGSINEWEDFSEPTLTLLDFTGNDQPNSRSDFTYDPADFDFRIWLGWNATHNRIYGSIQSVDDTYRGFEDASREDGLFFYVDGDHTGGPYNLLGGGQQDERQAQLYETYIYARVPDGPNVELAFLYESDWHNRPPYADAGGGVIAENPVFWVIEFYVTPFDELIWDDQEGGVISGLEVGSVVGLFIVIRDSDSDGSDWASYHIDDGFLRGGENAAVNADAFVDGLLLGADGNIPVDSVVRSDSWGRIKASLAE